MDPKIDKCEEDPKSLDSRFGAHGLMKLGWSAKPHAYWDFKARLKITAHEHQIIDYLTRRMDQEGQWSISVKRIASDVGTNASAVRISLRRLQNRGLISISETKTSKKTSAANTYSLLPLWDRIAVLVKERAQEPVPATLKAARATTMKAANVSQSQRDRISVAIKERKKAKPEVKEEIVDPVPPEDFAIHHTGMLPVMEMRRQIADWSMKAPHDGLNPYEWRNGGDSWLTLEGAHRFLFKLYPTDTDLIRRWMGWPKGDHHDYFFAEVAQEVIREWSALERSILGSMRDIPDEDDLDHPL